MKAGNYQKMREALEELIANIEMRSSTFGLNVMVDTKTFLDAKAALSAPPRNVDMYDNVVPALNTYDKIPLFDKEGRRKATFECWLFMEAKDEADGGAE